MQRSDPTAIFSNVGKEQLEKLPCSILALGLALMAAKKPTSNLGVGVDEDGYCQLRNMDSAIKRHFPNTTYGYIPKPVRKLLKDYICFPGNYIVCVKGHFIYVEEENYYSFYDNSNDEVVAWWSLG